MIMPNTKINPKNRQQQHQGVVGPPNQQQQQQQPLQPNTTSNTIPNNYNTTNTTNNIYGISSNNSGSSSNVPFRDPVELFGYNHEMDLALEQKLLSNLKKHSTKILTAAASSASNTTPNITASNTNTTTNANTNPTSRLLPSQATYSSYPSSSKNTYSHLHHNHPQSTTTTPTTTKTTSTGYTDIPSHKNRNTTTRTSYTSHPIRNPLPPPTTSTTTSPTGTTATPSAASNLHTNASTTSTTNNNSSVLLDPDLLTALTQRLSKVEETSKLQQRELYSKEQTLQSQAKQLDHYQTQVQQLMAERDRLKNQIHDMETFLNDYGLIWVGGDSDSGDSEDSSSEQIANNNTGSNDVDEEEESGSDNDDGDNGNDDSNDRGGDGDYTQVEAEKTNFKLDMDKIKRSVAELNILAGEGSSTFVKSTTGSPNLRQLKEQSKEVPITFFKNGFMIFAGPFRPYTVPSSIPFLNDICDGYFPYELKDRFPNGVAFRLTDLSSQVYPTSQHAPPPSSSFATNSAQQHLHPYSTNVTSSPHTGGSERNIHGMSSLDKNNAGAGITTKQFLHKLPVSVIRNGRVVDIRQTITNLTKGVVPQDNNQANLIVVPTDAIQHMQARSGAEDKKYDNKDNKDNNTDNKNNNNSSSNERGGGGGGVFDDTRKGPSTPRDITTLKLKTETGDTLIIKLKFDDTIGTLRDLVDKYRKDQSTYEIRTAFPNRVYHDPKITLRAAGLIPNATMFIKCINM